MGKIVSVYEHFGLRTTFRNELSSWTHVWLYWEYFLGGKGGLCLRWQSFYVHVPTVMKSGSLNHLEPLGPVWASNGIALPLVCTLRAVGWVDTLLCQCYWVLSLRHPYCVCNIMYGVRKSNTTSLLTIMTLLIERHVSAYSEAIIRFYDC